jgi:hypothetical protein
MHTIVSMVFAAVVAVASITVSISDVSAQHLVGDGEFVGTKIIVRELKRDEGGTVTVRLQLVNETDEPKALYEFLGNDWVHLIDAANKKRYLVVTDRSGKKCECTDGSQLRAVSKDSPINLWAKFPAPPEDVRSLTVVVKRFDPVASVPISAR